jgi:hypothetical protein
MEGRHTAGNTFQFIEKCIAKFVVEELGTHALSFCERLLIWQNGLSAGHKKSMGDNLVHALGPEKTRIERQVTPTLKAQTFTTCSNSIQRNFSGFRALPNK